MTSRYETDSSGHVWIRPAPGDRGQAREFRTYAGYIQERVIDDRSVIRWVYVRKNFSKNGSIEKCTDPRKLRCVVERIHASYLAEKSEYYRKSRGE